MHHKNNILYLLDEEKYLQSKKIRILLEIPNFSTRILALNKLVWPKLMNTPLNTIRDEVITTRVVDFIPFCPERPEHSVPLTKPRQNSVVFISVLIPACSGNSGQIPTGTSRFRSGCAIPALKSSLFCLICDFFLLILILYLFDFVFVLYNLKLIYLEF